MWPRTEPVGKRLLLSLGSCVFFYTAKQFQQGTGSPAFPQAASILMVRSLQELRAPSMDQWFISELYPLTVVPVISALVMLP